MKKLMQFTVIERKTSVYEKEVEVDPALSDEETCEQAADDFSSLPPRIRAKYKMGERDTYWGCEAELASNT